MLALWLCWSVCLSVSVLTTLSVCFCLSAGRLSDGFHRPPSEGKARSRTGRGGCWPAAAVGGKARWPDDDELALSSRPVHRVELPANPTAENARGIAALPGRLSHPRSLTCCCYLVSRSCEPSQKRARPEARRWCRRASRSPRPCTSSDENPGRGRSAGWSTTCCRRTWSATSARCTS